MTTRSAPVEDGKVDGADLVFEGEDLAHRLSQIDPAGKIQAIFTGIGGALMWKTAIVKGISEKERNQAAFKKLTDQTGGIMNERRSAVDNLLEIILIGCEDFNPKQKFELLKKLFGTHQSPYIYGKAGVHCRVRFRTHKDALPNAVRLRLPLCKENAAGTAIAMNPLLLLGRSVLELANMAKHQQKTLASVLRPRHQSAKLSHEKVEKLEFESLRAFHLSSAWDTLTVLYAMEEAIDSEVAKKFSSLVAGFPLSRLHASQAKMTLRRFFTDRQHVVMENFVFSDEVSTSFRAGDWLKGHPERGQFLVVAKKHLAILAHFASYFHYTDDPEAAYPQHDTQDEDVAHFEIFPKTAYSAIARPQETASSQRSFFSSQSAPMSPYG